MNGLLIQLWFNSLTVTGYRYWDVASQGGPLVRTPSLSPQLMMLINT